ncbi:peptidase [Staphylococcus roterodami]|nr:peptidase [Staphylococcus roterodami]
MKKVISLFVAILSVLIFTDNANAENNKPEGVNENSNLIPVRQPDANYPGPVSDIARVKKLDNLIDGTKDPNVIKQLKNAKVTSNNGAVNPSVKANDAHTKSNKQMAKQQSNHWDSKGKSTHKQQLKELPKTGVSNESNTATMALLTGLTLLVVSLVTRFIKLNSHQ